MMEPPFEQTFVPLTLKSDKTGSMASEKTLFKELTNGGHTKLDNSSSSKYVLSRWSLTSFASNRAIASFSNVIQNLQITDTC